jgi:hypothetical protein
LKNKNKQILKQTSRRKEIIEIKAKINEIEKKETYKESTKSWFFEKINKIERPLANLTKMRKEIPKSVKSEMQKGR